MTMTEGKQSLFSKVASVPKSVYSKIASVPKSAYSFFMKVRGGETPNASAIANKCGENGDPKLIGEDIRKATQQLKGRKVDVEIKLKSNKKCEVRVVDATKEIAHYQNEGRSDSVQKVFNLEEGTMDLQVEMFRKGKQIKDLLGKNLDVEIKIRKNKECEVNIYDSLGNHICKQTQELKIKDKSIDIELNITKNMLAMIAEQQLKHYEDIKEEFKDDESVSSSKSKQMMINSSSSTKKKQVQKRKPVNKFGHLSAEEQASIQSARNEALDNAGNEFDKIDINGDGEVDREEIEQLAIQSVSQMQGTHSSDPAVIKEKTNDFLDQFDEDGDGMIQKSEWLNFFGELFDSVIVQGLVQMGREAQPTPEGDDETPADGPLEYDQEIVEEQKKPQTPTLQPIEDDNEFYSNSDDYEDSVDLSADEQQNEQRQDRMSFIAGEQEVVDVVQRTQQQAEVVQRTQQVEVVQRTQQVEVVQRTQKVETIVTTQVVEEEYPEVRVEEEVQVIHNSIQQTTPDYEQWQIDCSALENMTSEELIAYELKKIRKEAAQAKLNKVQSMKREPQDNNMSMSMMSQAQEIKYDDMVTVKESEQQVSQQIIQRMPAEAEQKKTSQIDTTQQINTSSAANETKDITRQEPEAQSLLDQSRVSQVSKTSKQYSQKQTPTDRKSRSFTIVLNPSKIGAAKGDKIVDYSYREVERTKDGCIIRVTPKVVDKDGNPKEVPDYDYPVKFED